MIQKLSTFSKHIYRVVIPFNHFSFNLNWSKITKPLTELK